MGGMFFEIYQLAENETSRCSIFQDLPEDQDVVDLNCYVLVGSGHVSFDDWELKPQLVLNELLASFNKKQPNGFSGREMSASDIVILNGEAAYYCQNVGWRPIDVIRRKEIDQGGTSQ